MELKNLSEESILKIYKALEDEIFKNKLTAYNAKGYIVAGPIGSATFDLAEATARENNAIFINPYNIKSFLSKYYEIQNIEHPFEWWNFEYFCNSWTRNLFDKSIKNNYDIVVEYNFTSPIITKIIDELGGEGYQLESKIIAVDEFRPKLNVILENEYKLANGQTVEMCSETMQTNSFLNIDILLNRIIKNKHMGDISVFNYQGDQICGADPEKLIAREKEREWLKVEIQDFESKLKQAKSMMIARGASKWEIRRVNDLKTNYKLARIEMEL